MAKETGNAGSLTKKDYAGMCTDEQRDLDTSFGRTKFLREHFMFIRIRSEAQYGDA
jgi:hypothetical protein